MFDVGGPEFLFLLLLALLVFGPRRLPTIGRKLGSFVGEMRRSLADFRGHLEREVAYEEMREVAEGLKDVGRGARDATRGLANPEPRRQASPGSSGNGSAGRKEGESGAEAEDPQKPAESAGQDGATDEPRGAGPGQPAAERPAEAEAAYRSMEAGSQDGDPTAGESSGEDKSNR